MNLTESLAVSSLLKRGIEVNAGGPGSGRRPGALAESAASKDEHLAAVKYHNEQASVLMQKKGQSYQDAAFAHSQAAQSHADAARLGTDRHSHWARGASGNANAMSERLGLVAAGTEKKEEPEPSSGKRPGPRFRKLDDSLQKAGFRRTGSSQMSNDSSAMERHTYQHPEEGVVTVTHNKMTEKGVQQQKTKKAKETKDKNAANNKNVNVNVKISKEK